MIFLPFAPDLLQLAAVGRKVGEGNSSHGHQRIPLTLACSQTQRDPFVLCLHPFGGWPLATDS